tara:strand:+ start:341 stop:586 length:246 start_codon:yes stop_codon:yes gene_type:complete
MVDAPSTIVQGKYPSHRGGQMEVRTSLERLMHDAFVESISADRARAWLTPNADGDRGVMRAVNGRPIDFLQDGVFQSHLFH